MHLFTELKPTALYLSRLCFIKFATKWSNIGLELDIDSEVLDIIDADYKNDVQKCCSIMLRKWLDSDPEASWGKLFDAVENAKRHYDNDSDETIKPGIDLVENVINVIIIIITLFIIPTIL